MADNRLGEMEVNPNKQMHPAAYRSVHILSTTGLQNIKWGITLGPLFFFNGFHYFAFPNRFLKHQRKY